MATNSLDPRQQQGFLPMLNSGQQQSTNQWGISSSIPTTSLNADTGQFTLPDLTPAQFQLSKYNASTNYGGGHPGYGGYGSKNAKGNLINGGVPSDLGQNTPWEWGGEGGKAATAVSAFGALGGLYLGNEARKLAASDLDFRRDSFNKQYDNQVATVNDSLYDRQRRRSLESGLNTEQAGIAADKYVNDRGVGRRTA